MKSLLLFILFLLLSLNACKKKQYCIYRRYDLQSNYLLIHPTKKTILFYISYNHSNPYNVYKEDSSIKLLDSLINKENYSIDTIQSKDMKGYTYEIDGNCQYCDYYHTISQNIFCELRGE